MHRTIFLLCTRLPVCLLLAPLFLLPTLLSAATFDFESVSGANTPTLTHTVSGVTLTATRSDGGVFSTSATGLTGDFLDSLSVVSAGHTATITFSAPIDVSALSYWEAGNPSATGGNYVLTPSSGTTINLAENTIASFHTDLSPTDWAGITSIVVSYSNGGGNFFVGLDTIVFTLANDAPTTANLNGDTLAFTEDSGAQVLDQGTAASVSDSDNPSDLNGGTVTVSIVANRVAGEDVLSIRNQGTGAGQIGVSGSNVTYAGTTIGTFTGGTGTDDLVITLNANSTLTNVGALLQNVTYNNTNSGNPSTNARTVRVTVNDGDGGTSAAADVTVNITGVNDNPGVSGLPGSLTFLEDATLAGFQLNLDVNDFVDPDSANLTVTLAVSSGTIGLANPGGTLTQASGNGTGTVILGGTLANVNTYFNTPTNITWTPPADLSGDGVATIVITANDGDGSGNVSLGTININITAVNDAPSFTSGATLSAVDEDASSPAGATISSLLAANFADVDTGNTFAGIAITASAANSGTEGRWQYSTDSGSTWFDVGSVSTSGALLVNTSSLLRFLPVAGFNGTPGALTVYAVDNSSATTFTSGSTRQTFDTTSDDATSKVAASGVSLSTSITAINDAPTLTATGLNPTFAEGGSAVDLFGTVSASTVDSGQTFAALTLTVTSVGDGASEILAIGGTDVALTNGNSGALTGIGSYSVSVTAGTATVSVTGMTRDNTQMGTLVDGITYRNTAVPPAAAARVVTLTGIQDSGGTANGGVDAAVLSLASTVATDLAPTLTGQTVPANATYKIGQHLDFTVIYSENVTVNTGGGTPYIAVTLDTGGGVQAAYNGGTGTTTLTFRYTVASGNLDTNGVAVASSITLNGGTIKDSAGSNAPTTSLGFGSTASVLVDGVAPSVSSINRQTPSGSSTNATSVVYRVTFTESVTGVDATDFTLTKTGTADGTVASVSGSGAVYDVTVNTISGAGTLRLDLNNAGTGIADDAANAIATGYTSGQTYTIDTNAPALDTIARQTLATVHTDATSVTWRVTFTEGVTGVDTADFTLTQVSGTGAGTIASVTPVSTSVYDVVVNGITGQGQLRLDLKSTGTGIADLAGNAIADGGFTSGAFYIVGVTSVFEALNLTVAANVNASQAGPNKVAQRFTTAAGQPLTLSSVVAKLNLVTATPTPVVQIRADNAGAPGAAVGSALTNPASLTPNVLNVWTGSVALDASTTYWIVFEDTASSYSIDVSTQTTGGTGDWLSNPDYLFRYGANAGVTQTGALLLALGATSTPSITSSLTANATTGSAFSYNVTATNTPTSFAATGLPAGLSVNTSTGEISGTPTQAGTFNISLTATNASGTGPASTLVLTVGVGTATVVLGDLSATYDGTPKSASATTTPSGLTVDITYDASSTAPTNAGSYAVVATINNANFTGSANGTLVIAKADQTVTFSPVGSVVIGTPVALSATASSGLPVTYSVVSGNGSISGGNFTAIDANPVTLRASQSGNGNYNAALDEQTFTPAKIPSTVTLGGLAHTFDGTPKSATATTTPSGLTVNTTYDGGATVPTNAGSYAVVATINDATHAGSASGTLVVAKANQSVTFPSVGSLTVGTAVTLTATASSGLPVTFSVVSGNATIAGASLTADDANAITVRATQAGNANYNAASADQTIASDDITKLSQTITFAPPADHLTTDAAFALNATASSGLTVSFTVQSGPATVSGNTLTLTGAPGTVTIVASQEGNAAYTVAPSVTRDFAVTAPGELIYFGTLSDGVQNVGTLAGHLQRDGTQGVLIGHLPGQSAGFVANFTPDATGAFVVTITPITLPQPQSSGNDPTVAAAQALWTFHGQLTGDTITGTITELGVSYGVVADPVSGPTSAMAGYYASSSLDTTTGAIHTIVGTEGDVFVLATLSDLVAAGTSTVNGTTGDFVTDLGGGVTLDGNVDAPTTTVDGTIIRSAGGSTTDFAGVRSDTTRSDRLVNLSSRARVGTGENVVVTGFVISGSAPKPVLLRAVGPGLAEFNLAGVLADPRMTLMQDGSILATNDDWGAAANAAEIATTMQQTGAFSLASDSKDAAILVTLQPGLYTAIIEGVAGGGIALAEVYDASLADGYQRLLNISTRGYVGPGADTLIGGFIVTGNAPKRILVRGVGPRLAAFGVGNSLSDPSLTLFAGGTAIAQNTDWGAGANPASDLAAAATATGAFALDAGSKDAAILITLAPGVYTAHVTSANNATGIALVEVYEVPEQ